jgi:hypothetical protein
MVDGPWSIAHRLAEHVREFFERNLCLMTQLIRTP